MERKYIECKEAANILSLAKSDLHTIMQALAEGKDAPKMMSIDVAHMAAVYELLLCYAHTYEGLDIENECPCGEESSGVCSCKH